MNYTAGSGIVTRGLQTVTSDRDLGADLYHPAGRNLEKVGGVGGALGETDEQPILPARHAGMRRRLQRAPRQEERGRHDVEVPALLPRDGERLRHIGRLHVAEAERDAHEML